MQLTFATIALCLSPVLSAGYKVHPFQIDLTSRLSHMKDLVQRTQLPSTSVLGSAGAGVDLSWLKDRQVEWLGKYDWKKEQDALNKSVVVYLGLTSYTDHFAGENRFNHSTVDIRNMTVHFIHQRSPEPDAIPLILTHGWPGSFYEFSHVISPLSSPGKGSNTS